MDLADARKIEQLADVSASAALGGAVGFAIFAVAEPIASQPALGALAAGAAGIAFLSSRRLLAWVMRGSGRLDGASVAGVTAADARVGDPPIVAVDPDSRVVRLFDPSATPRPSKIGPDATEALHEALSQLRRSLR